MSCALILILTIPIHRVQKLQQLYSLLRQRLLRTISLPRIETAGQGLSRKTSLLQK